MRFAVISNIHANAPALQAVLRDIDAQATEVERVVCAGDVVGLGPRPNEVLNILRERQIETIRGNYDDAVAFQRLGSGVDFADAEAEAADARAIVWTRRELTEENTAFLQKLPRDLRLLQMPGSVRVKRDAEDEEVARFRKNFLRRALFGGLVSERPQRVRMKRVRIVHGSPRAMNEFVREDSATSILTTIGREADADILVSAHAASPFQRLVDQVHFVGVPAVSGVGKAGRAEYALLTVGQDLEVEFRAVDYDPEEHIRDIAGAGLPEAFGTRHNLRLV